MRTADYSNTKLNTFRQCRCKYKLQYIDKIKVDRTKSIETFLGSRVHETLEKLYRDKTFCKDLSLGEILDYYRCQWDALFDESITIAKKEYTADNYRDLGERYITDYYNSHKPFDDMRIIGLETEDQLILPNGRTYDIRMDKFACRGNEYYVCDYKTDSRLKTKEEADSDRQLAMYSVWVKQNYPDAKNVHLVWHMLKFDKDVTSERTDKQLGNLVNQIVSEIETIESNDDWSPNVTNLCNYCEFRNHCPEFRHEEFIESAEPEKLTEDEAYNAVNECVLLDAQIKELNRQSKDLGEKKKALTSKIIDYANSNGFTSVYGESVKCSVSRNDSVVLIENRKDELKSKLIGEGRSDYLQLATTAIQSGIRKGEVGDLFDGYAVVEEDYKATFSKREKSK